jgi:hypothetical protein
LDLDANDHPTETLLASAARHASGHDARSRMTLREALVVEGCTYQRSGRICGRRRSPRTSGIVSATRHWLQAANGGAKPAEVAEPLLGVLLHHCRVTG